MMQSSDVGIFLMNIGTDPGRGGQRIADKISYFTDRFRKRYMFIKFYKLEHIPSVMADKAVTELFIRIYRKRRIMVIMKRT